MHQRHRRHGSRACSCCWILEGVACIVVNLDLDLLSLFLHRRLEFVNIIGRDALILRSE